MTSVLIIEDDHDTRVSLRLALEATGYYVLTAADGAQALQVLAQVTPPSIILLDLALPLMNGEMFLKCKEANPKLRSVPVVIMSANAEEKKRFPEPFLVKPFGLEPLLKVIEEQSST